MEKTKIRPREIYQRSEEFGLLSSANMLIGIIESDKDNKRRLESIKYLALIYRNNSAREPRLGGVVSMRSFELCWRRAACAYFEWSKAS